MGPTALALLDAGWDRCLTSQDSAGSPSLSAPWLRGLAAALAPPLRPIVLRLDRPDGSMSAGMALTVRTVGLGAGAVRIGTWLGHPRRVFAPDLVGGSAHPEHAAAVMRAALARIGVLVLHNTPLDGALWPAAAATAPWATRLPASAPQLLSLPSPSLARRRREVAYERRRAERRGARVEIELASDPVDIAEALETLLGLHRRRWAGRREQSGFSRTLADRALHRRLLPAAAAHDRVVIAVVREDGRAVGATCGLRAGSRGMIYRTAMADGGSMRGPGIAATVAALAHLEATGVRLVDLGIGEQLYKRRLGARPGASGGLAIAASPRLQGALDLVLAGRRRLREPRSSSARWGGRSN